MGERIIRVAMCDACGEDLPDGEQPETFEIGISRVDGEVTRFVAELGGKCRKELRAVLDALHETILKRAEETGDVLPVVAKTSAASLEGLSARELGQRAREWWKTDKAAQKQFGLPTLKGRTPTAVTDAYINAMMGRIAAAGKTGAREKVRV